jgi:hypothetical protein
VEIQEIGNFLNKNCYKGRSTSFDSVAATGVLIETTERRVKYYGAVVNDIQALALACEEAPELTDPAKETKADVG